MTVKRNMYVKNSVIQNISYAGFIKKNKVHLEILEFFPFFRYCFLFCKMLC
jgi:hypothetical protein